MRAELEDFLIDVSNMYPVRKEQNYDSVIGQTTDALLEHFYDKEIDFKQAKSLLYNEYDKTTFPLVPKLKEYLGKCIIKKSKINKDEGCLVIQILPTGEIRNYVMTSESGTTTRTLEQRGRVFYFPKGSYYNYTTQTVEQPDGKIVNIREL